MFKNILVCLDGSKFAEQILPYAISMAQRFDGQLILLEVTKAPSAIVESSLGLYRATKVEDILRSEVEASKYLESVAKKLLKKKLEVKYTSLSGKPGEVIVDYAQKNRIGLIALTTHGRTGLQHVVFGSVAEFVLRNSGLPVLLKRPV
jgi:nucleotide-binding universal stress UspA family protein